MDLRALARPAAELLTSRSFIPSIPRRGHKTTARTKRALKIAPHDSFLPSRTAYPAADTIIYNPPASEASPSHTPYLFLPRTDPRRQMLRNGTGGELPPAMRYKHRAANPRYHLTPKDFAEMKKLREQDPLKWSVSALANKFDCSEMFVQIAAPASVEHHDWLRGKMERKAARWGAKKSQAREDRKRRAEMVYKGEL